MFKRKITVSDEKHTGASHLTLRQSLLPCCLVTILFFLWGVAYGLLDVLNSHFQTTLSITPSKASGLSAAYFGAYSLCPLTISGWILRRFDFRLTFVTGLAVLAVGCLLFWPSGIKKSFGGFCGSMFIVGAGLSTLETAADPFLAICGPPRYSQVRLNLAQAVQGVGGLKNVQWTYLGVAFFVGLLMILFLFAPFPEITDADMGLQEVEVADHDSGPFRKQTTLFLGVASQFCYVGAQVAIANYAINFITETGQSKALASDLFAVGQGIYAANRFIAGGCVQVFPPMMGAVVTKRNAHTAMAIPMMGFLLALIFPIYVNLYQKDRMDKHRETTLGLEPSPNQKELALEDKTPQVEQVETR